MTEVGETDKRLLCLVVSVCIETGQLLFTLVCSHCPNFPYTSVIVFSCYSLMYCIPVNSSWILGLRPLIMAT